MKNALSLRCLRASAVSLLAAIALLAPSHAAAQTDTRAAPKVTSTGNVASGAPDSGNPVKTGCVYSTAGNLTAVAAGSRVDGQCDDRGNFRAQIVGSLGTPSDSGGSNVLCGSRTAAATFAPCASLGYVWNGTNVIAERGDANGIATGKGLSSTRWRYTSGTSPILSNTTTAVTIKTAAGAGVKNAIDGCQLTTTAFGASVPLAIRDGASGTVMWALTVPTAGFLQPVTFTFEQPLVGSANTLIEVVTTTANTSGTVTLNCQGHTET
jgi:hypothetical protein